MHALLFADVSQTSGTNAILRHLLRPMRGGAAAVVIVFAFLLWIASSAGLLGIPLALILGSWFFKYAYILFDHVVRGIDEPPALDINMVNPFSEQRPLLQLLILIGLGGGITIVATNLSSALAVAVAAIASLLVPASVAILGLEGNVFKAIYPIALARMILGLGPLYLVILAIVAGAILLIGISGKLHLWMPIQIAGSMFALLSIFSGMGGALYERRHQLGLETWHSPERTAEKQRQADLREHHNLVTEAYGQVRVGAHTKAWKILQDWLASRNFAAEDYRWLLPKVSAWPDKRYANRLTEEYVDRLLALKRTGEALDAVVARLKLDADFRPKSAAATLKIAELAARAGGTSSVARILLKDFGARFPGDAQGEAAAALARHLGA